MLRRILAATAAMVAISALPGQDRLTPELLWNLRRVSDPQPSPDGKFLMYGVRTYDIDANRGVSQLYLRELTTGVVRQLTTQKSNWSGRWSPDGRRVAFLSNRAGAPQVFILDLGGGEARQITERAGGVANLAGSPSGTHLSFTAEVKLDPDLRDMFPDLPKADARIYDSLLIRHWDSWKEGKYSHLFSVPVDGGEARDLMPGERFDTPVKPFGGGNQIAWSPDGKELCYTAKKVSGSRWSESTNNDLYVVPVGGGEAKNITKGMMGYDQEPVYSPDGSTIAFVSMERAGFESDRNRLMVYDRATGAIRELTLGFDQSVHGVVWAPDSKSLYFDSDVLGTTQIYRIELTGSAPRPISSGRYQFRGAAVSHDGKHVYCLRQRTERPYEIVRLETGAPTEGEPQTDENGPIYANLGLPKVEERWFDATDGKRIHSWVIYPPDFDPAKKWPMLLYCQGGPQSQVGQWFSYRWNFHLMAAQGYVVLAVNRRGLPGFGQAWNDQISRDWGGQAMQDLLSANDQMVKEPFIDADRVGAVGASFGGYTIFWLMGHDEPDRFKAMIAHCGVFHLESMYLSTEEHFFVNWDLGGPYWASPEIARDYKRFSPHSFVGTWDTPLLVIHGEKDFRVPLAQGLQAFTAAQLKGVPSRFLYFPEEGHWVLSPQNGLLWHRVFFDWLQKHCKQSQPEAATKPANASRVGSAEPAEQRRYLLERIGDTAVVQLYADGFDGLSFRDKMLCYHLSEAAVAGRDIFIDQKFSYSLRIRDLLEELYLHRSAMPAAIAAEVERYTKLFWVHNGIHNSITTRKEKLQMSPDGFRASLRTAQKSGAELPDEDACMALYEVMTNDAYASCTNKSPGEGRDPVQASCNNLYIGVTTDELEGFAEKNALNSRVVRMPDGQLVEQVYRAGDGADIPPGLYARQLNNVIEHLEAALPYAPEKTAKALRLLIKYYRTGEIEDWRAYNIAWVQDGDSVVDQINGFVEVYLDARGQKGAWEAVVSFLDPAKTAGMQPLLKDIQWFEDRMPWDDEFKKKNVRGILFRAISVIMETGDSGPITPIGINLPNEADIRQNHGSKSVNLSNVVETYERSRAGGSAREFSSSEAEVARALKWSSLSGDVHTNLHEVIGHASGQVRPEVKNPAGRLGTYYSTLEEARADLIALYWIADPKLREMNIVPHPDAALAEYEGYARNALVQLRRVRPGGRLEDDHMRNRQMVIHWLIDNTEAIAVEKRDGKTYYRVTSVDAFRAGCATLLREVMRIKATGDFKAGKALVDTYGTKVDSTLHQEVLARIKTLDLPSATGFVQPELRLVRDAHGVVTDVEVHYPQDLAAQMLRWSGRRR